MNPTLQELGIDQLSIDDRLTLVGAIWDSIAASPEQLPITDFEKQILDRRLAELDANPQNVLTWQEIKAHVQSR